VDLFLWWTELFDRVSSEISISCFLSVSAVVFDDGVKFHVQSLGCVHHWTSLWLYIYWILRVHDGKHNSRTVDDITVTLIWLCMELCWVFIVFCLLVRMNYNWNMFLMMDRDWIAQGWRSWCFVCLLGQHKIRRSCLWTQFGRKGIHSSAFSVVIWAMNLQASYWLITRCGCKIAK